MQMQSLIFILQMIPLPGYTWHKLSYQKRNNLIIKSKLFIYVEAESSFVTKIKEEIL